VVVSLLVAGVLFVLYLDDVGAGVVFFGGVPSFSFGFSFSFSFADEDVP
jgi:hypothetical protein